PTPRPQIPNIETSLPTPQLQTPYIETSLPIPQPQTRLLILRHPDSHLNPRLDSLY
ncbi:hypothetical protein LOTGIDRAFT_102208, partial [Lottia gigantea]